MKRPWLPAVVVALLGAGLLAATAFAGGPNGSSLLDDFNRADGAAGANWTADVTGFTLSNQHTTTSCTSTICFSTWNVSTWADTEVAAKYQSNIGTGNHTFALYCRVANPGASATGYRLTVTSTNSVSIGVMTAGSTVTALDTTTGWTFAIGDSFAFDCYGRHLLAYWQSGSTGSWTQIAAASDTTYSAAGYAGLGSVGEGMDDFAAGASSGPTVYSTTTLTSTIYTGQATVTSGGGGTVAMGGNCGGTTTDAGGSTIAQAPCKVDVSTGGTVAGFLNNLHDDLFVLVGAVLGAALIPLIVRWFTGGRD